MQNLIDKIDNIHSKKNIPKYQTAYGNINLDGREINHLYQNVQKNQRIIKNYETVFQMIEKMNDNQSYFSLKRELDKNKYKVKKNKKNKDFGKHFLNINNYQEIISDPNDKQNEDEKFMFSLINHIENRIKPKKKNNLIFNNFHLNRNKKNFFNNNNLKNLTTTNSFNNTFLSTTIGNEIHKSFTNKKKFDKNNFPILSNNNNYNENKKETILLLPKTLNKGLFKIYKKIIQNEEKLEKENYKINNEIKFSQTNYNFNNLDNFKRNKELNLIKKKMMRKKVLEKKYKDNSLFDFPLTNKIIYKDLKKVDYFEKAKDKLVNDKINEQKIKIKKKIEFFKMLEKLEEEEKQKEEEENKNKNSINVNTNIQDNKQSN